MFPVPSAASSVSSVKFIEHQTLRLNHQELDARAIALGESHSVVPALSAN